MAALLGAPVMALGLLPPLVAVRDAAVVRCPALHLLATALAPSGPGVEVDLTIQQSSPRSARSSATSPIIA